MKSLIRFTAALFPFVIIAGYIVFKDNLPNYTYTKNNGLVPEEMIPDGWYPHAFGTSTVLLTRSRFIKHYEGTEGYAYGEQIYVGVDQYNGELGKEEEWEQISWIYDESEYGNLKTEWQVVNGHKVLRILSDGMTGSGDLSYKVFVGDKVYILYLYPAYDSPHLDTFETFFREYVRSFTSNSVK